MGRNSTNSAECIGLHGLLASTRSNPETEALLSAHGMPWSDEGLLVPREGELKSTALSSEG